MDAQRRYPEARGAFSGLLSDVAFAAKVIAAHVNRAGLVDILGEAGGENVQGERVQKLDVYAHETLARIAGRSGHVCVMASEEWEQPVAIEPGYPCGRYVLVFDPLDGSSNIDVNISIGTIFSIFRRVTREGPGTLQDLLQGGYRQVAAGYVVYGSSTMFVYTAGTGVHGFTLDPSVGEFLLSHEDIRIPRQGRIYSVNDANLPLADPRVGAIVDQLRRGWEGHPPLTARYAGSLVADFHRNLLRGGVFLYPAVARHPGESPKPKLRLLYEAAPLAYIVDQAGGYASDGEGPILRREPRSLHERVPLFIGSVEDVQLIEGVLRGARALPGT